MGPEPSRPALKNRFSFLGLAISPAVCRLRLDPQTASIDALSQAQNDIGSMLFDGAEKLALVKSNRKDDFFSPGLPGQAPENFFRNVILKLAVRAKAVDEETHSNITQSATRHGRP